MSDIHAMTLTEATAAFAAGTLSARALADAQLARVDATDGAIEAWAHLDPAHVRREADRLDGARAAPPSQARATPPAAARGTRAATVDADGAAAAVAGPLAGVGIGVKDIVATADQPTAFGSPIFEGHLPTADAACVGRLMRAGGYVFGKTVTTAFAFLDPGRTRNPWNRAHTPGGSSSGSAAAVAARQVCAAIGTQTNGSVIRPAAFCGVVGFKPTLGAIPADGVHVFSETLDTVGTFTRTVADAARLAAVLADPGRIGGAVAPFPRAPRLAYLSGFPWTQVGGDADVALDAAATTLRAAGADVVPVSLPDALAETARTLRTIMLFEAATHLASLQDRERARLTPALNAALDEGRAIDEDAYRRALASRRVMIAAAQDWLSRYDALIAPPATGPAPEGLGTTGDPSCCTMASLLGFPALSLPIGLAANGMPLGMQIVAPADADDRVLAVAAWCEARLPFAGLPG
jgi:Asp-tRNA(Asn)/Glu-tRNA(Gln) amidotransferase A subunit family amidase